MHLEYNNIISYYYLTKKLVIIGSYDSSFTFMLF